MGLDFKGLGCKSLYLSTLQALRNNPPAGGDECVPLRNHRIALHYRPDRPFAVPLRGDTG